MTTDRPRRRSLAPALAPIIALGVLIVLVAASCSSEGAGDRVAADSDGPSSTTATDGTDGASPTTADAGAADPSSSTAAGTLALTVGRGGVTLTVTAGAEALVVLADMSLATVSVDGTAWSVAVARPDGPRSSTADLPDSFDGVLARPGQAVDVGPYELGPRPPTELSLCLEVVTASAADARGATGDEVLLPAGTGSPTTLCATTSVG